jgi:hypothetical protein
MLLLGCKKTTPPDFHLDYFGQEEGRYVIYDVVEIFHDVDAAVKHDTNYYQLKTVWNETFVDNEGRDARIFRRYVRNQATDPWVLQDVWTGLIDGIRAELIEENQRVVKLIFSPTIEKEWDANAYNPNDELSCYYDDIHQSHSLGVNDFDSTVMVEQADDPDPVRFLRKYEVYAKGIGLVEKVSRDLYLEFQTQPQSGYELFYTYVSSGYE